MRKTVTRLAATAGAFAVTGVAATMLKNTQAERRRALHGDAVEFGSLRGEARDVIADDGVSINVDVDEGPEPTVIFLHGWMCNSDTWHFQRLALRGSVKLVFMDHRGHGRSGRASRNRYRIDDLADDLRRVIENVAPAGPIVLVGHSMGGMTIMRLAGAHPELFGEVVKGAVLVATSAGGLRRSSPAMKFFGPAIKAMSPVLDWGREFNSLSIIKRWGVGPEATDLSVNLTHDMLMREPSRVIADYYPLISSLDLLQDLANLSRIRTVVMGGTRDLMTPFSHSRRIAKRIPGAELIAVAGTGHMVPLEEPEQVTEAIERILKDIS